jgi:hypothetical protein
MKPITLNSLFRRVSSDQFPVRAKKLLECPPWVRHKNKEQVAVGCSFVERELSSPFGDIAATVLMDRQ